MFEELTNRLQTIFRKLHGYGRLSEKDVRTGLREIRVALLEADVNYKVAKDFIHRIEEKAVGKEVLQGLRPADALVKIVYEELTNLLGRQKVGINFSSIPTIISLVGLQGSGKTTTACKLGLKFKARKPLLVACDFKRPAAYEQLQILSRQTGLDFFEVKEKDLTKLCRSAIESAEEKDNRVVILDTAGRLHIDDELMDELVRIRKKISPSETILVVDGATGQDAVNIASEFDTKLGIDSIILTKLDGDARGGGALSIRAVTGKPIKFVGMGEKVKDLAEFYPDRLASRILGMGDVLSLIEKTEAIYKKEEAKRLETKMRKETLTFDDFLQQLKATKKMGPLEEIIKMIPGMSGKLPLDLKTDEDAIVKVEAIINSMTKEERVKPHIIDGSRRKRIAKGSGTSVKDVNQLLRQFELAKKLMRKLSKGKSPFKIGGFR